MCLLRVGSELRRHVKFVKSKVIAVGATIIYEPAASIIQAAFVFIRNNNMNYSMLLQHRHYCCNHRYKAKLCGALFAVTRYTRVFGRTSYTCTACERDASSSILKQGKLAICSITPSKVDPICELKCINLRLHRSFASGTD